MKTNEQLIESLQYHTYKLNELNAYDRKYGTYAILVKLPNESTHPYTVIYHQGEERGLSIPTWGSSNIENCIDHIKRDWKFPIEIVDETSFKAKNRRELLLYLNRKYCN